MAETIKLEIPRAEAEQFQSLIEECLVKMRQAQIEMERDQEEINRLKAQTRAKLAEIRKLVA